MTSRQNLGLHWDSQIPAPGTGKSTSATRSRSILIEMQNILSVIYNGVHRHSSLGIYSRLFLLHRCHCNLQGTTVARFWQKLGHMVARSVHSCYRQLAHVHTLLASPPPTPNTQLLSAHQSPFEQLPNDLQYAMCG